MNLREIYNLLLAGKVIKLNFASETEKETFRVKLFKFKRLQELAMLQVGMIEESEIQSLKFEFTAPVASISLIKKRGLRDYAITIMDDDDGQAASSEEADVPGDLGKSQGQ